MTCSDLADNVIDVIGLGFSTKSSLGNIFFKKNEFKDALNEFGVLQIKTRNLDNKLFRKYVDLYTGQYANDALRRQKTSKIDGGVFEVDVGLSRHELHSEASFSPSWPSLIWFHAEAVDDDFKVARTTFADGIEIWSSLPNDLKKIFLEKRIRYHCAIPLGMPKKYQKLKKREWFIEEIGCSDLLLDYEQDLLFFKQHRYAVHEHFSGKLAFVNHLLMFPEDPQILEITLDSMNQLSDEQKEKIISTARESTYFFEWEDINSFVCCDNRRMMHGREEIPKNSTRKLRIIQTLVPNWV